MILPCEHFLDASYNLNKQQVTLSPVSTQCISKPLATLVFLFLFCFYYWYFAKNGFTDHLLCWVISRVWPFVTLWTLTHQAPLSMGFSRQEYWSGLPFPSSGHLPNPGTNLHFLCLLHCRRLGFFIHWAIGKAQLPIIFVRLF